MRCFIYSAMSAALISMPLAAQAPTASTAEYPSYEPPASVKNGYTAEDLRDAEIRGTNGKTIGDIEDLIIGPDGQLRRLLVSVNEGFLGIGGRMLVVNWKDLKPGPRQNGNVEYFTAAVTKQNVEEFGIFKDKQEGKASKREWRASELIGDYASLQDQNDYGVVTDIMFDQQGQVRAIATAPDLTGSVLPFWAAYSGTDKGWDPGDDYYVLPYSRAEVAKLLPGKQDQKTRVSTAPGSGGNQ